MENLSMWLLISAGATVGLLATFLFASERELKNKRRDCEELKSQLKGSQTDKAIDPCAEAQNSKTDSSLELIRRNKELAEEISSLSSRLEESQRTIDGLQTEQRRLLNAQSESQKLCAENHQLQQVIANLRNQLQTSESLLSTTASEHKEVADRHFQLQSELSELKQQMDKLMMNNKELLEENKLLSSKLETNQRTMEDLQTIQRRLIDTESENQQLHAANQEVQQQIANVNNQLQRSQAQLNDSAGWTQEMADRNSKLQSEVVELKQQLQANHNTIEALQTEQQRLGDVVLENRQLQQEIADLRNRLDLSEARLSDSAKQNQEAADRHARLQSEVAVLKEQAKKRQPKARELEAVQQQLANFESREAIFKNQQRQLEAHIADLQQELSRANGKERELDANYKRLAEMELICQELREKNRRHEEDVSRWRERLAGSEESHRQISALRRQLDELQTKQATIDGNQWQKERAAVGQPRDESSRRTADSDLPRALPSTTNTVVELTQGSIDAAGAYQVERAAANSPINGLTEHKANYTYRSSDDSGARTHGANGETIKPAAQAGGKRHWRFGMIAAMLVLVIVAGAAVGFLSRSTDKISGLEEPAVASGTFDEQPTPIDIPSRTPKGPSSTSMTGLREDEFSKQAPRPKPAPRLVGPFKVTRPTHVYSGPSENSPLIASIEPGVRVNVVDSRNGWLEIRSKHGRPPGFIRQEAAVRIDQN